MDAASRWWLYGGGVWCMHLFAKKQCSTPRPRQSQRPTGKAARSGAAWYTFETSLPCLIAGGGVWGQRAEPPGERQVE